MNALFLMISYPDVYHNTNMYTDLVDEFIKNGHNIYVATADRKRNHSCKIEGGAYVLRIRTLELFEVNPIFKGFALILLPYQFRTAIKRIFPSIKFDLIIMPTPPITLVKNVKYLKKKTHAKFYLILRDIFPQNARDLGLIKNPLIFKYFRKKEKELYSFADYIGCMSPANIEYVISHNREVDKEKLHLLPNWIKVKPYTEPQNDFKSKYKLKNKFVAIFGGNLGKPQSIEFILELARHYRANLKIVFLIVGRGTEKKKIDKIIEVQNLANVQILDYIPREEFNELVKECDIGLVNLSDKFTIPNMPSRTLAYWVAKLPILAATDKNTDYRIILEQSKGGLWAETGDITRYKLNFERLYKDEKLRKSMGKNGYKYLCKHMNSENAHKTIISNFINV